MSGAYYNEIDPYAAAWLRNLIAAGHIAPGDVDERDIRIVHPVDLLGYDQCHFFAGIGVWSYALRLAGWPDDEQVWTGSCPCQPFSAAGAGGGADDARHLWPHWWPLIRDHRPNRVFGEQVASRLGRSWLVAVRADLEDLGYGVGRLDTCAAGVGAPHIRQRLYFVADHHAAGRSIERGVELLDGERPAQRDDADGRRGARELADADGRDACAEWLQRGREHGLEPEDRGASAVVNAEQPRLEGHGGHGDDRNEPGRLGADQAGSTPAAGATGGFWNPCNWLACIDGKARPVEPGTFPLAHGAPARVGRLRAYGNAIVAPQAAEFIRAYRDSYAR